MARILVAPFEEEDTLPALEADAAAHSAQPNWPRQGTEQQHAEQPTKADGAVLRQGKDGRRLQKLRTIRGNPNGRVVLLTATFEPVGLDPYDTVAHRLLGKQGSAKLWRVAARLTPFTLFLWVAAGAATLMLYLGYQHSILVWLPPFGLVQSCFFLMFCNLQMIARLLRTFESAYLLLLLTVWQLGSCLIFGDWRSLAALHVGASFSCIILIDAAPLKMRVSRATQYGVFVGVVVMCIGLVYIMVNKQNVFGLKESIYLPVVGNVSVLQRMVAYPIWIMLAYFVRNLYMLRRHRRRLTVVKSRLKEITFENRAALETYFACSRAQIVENARGICPEDMRRYTNHLANVETQAKPSERTEPKKAENEDPARHKQVATMTLMEAQFESQQLDPYDIIAPTWLSFEVKQWLWQAVKSNKVRFVGALTWLGSAIVTALAIFGIVDPYFSLVALIGAVSTLPLLLLLNRFKARLLCRLFVPVLLLANVFVLCIGIILLFSDVRSVCAVQIFPSFLVFLSIDAQPPSVRFFRAGLSFLTVLFLTSTLLTIYTDMIPGARSTVFQAPSGMSVSSVQILIISPVCSLLPYAFNTLYVSLVSSEGTLFIKAPVFSHFFGTLREIDAHITQEQSTAMMHMSMKDRTAKKLSTRHSKYSIIPIAQKTLVGAEMPRVAAPGSLSLSGEKAILVLPNHYVRDSGRVEGSGFQIFVPIDERNLTTRDTIICNID